MKCPPSTDEKNYLQKTFKFFDIQNKGSVNLEQFVRSCEKIGVVFANEEVSQLSSSQRLQKTPLLFNIYDRDGSGRIDYKEFTHILVEGGKTASELEEESARNIGKPASKYQKEEDTDMVTPQQLLTIFKDKLKARGARGIVGIQKLFKIMDDDGSKTLNSYEFGKVCRDFKMGISEENIPILFAYFDSNRDGTLNIDEFLYAIRGDLNERRMALVQ